MTVYGTTGGTDMYKIGGFVTILLAMTASLSWSGSSGFTLEGEIRGAGDKGDVYYRLVGRGAFEESADKDHFRMGDVIPVGTQEHTGESLTFVLENVPPGRYALQSFQDVNGNEKLDIGMFGPKEPWGNYRHSRPRFRAPTFDECAFDVNGPLEGITVELE